MSIDYSMENASLFQNAYLFGFYDLFNEFQLFEIKEVQDEDDGESTTRTIYAENVFYELRDNIIERSVLTNVNALLAVNNAIQGSRWQVGDIDNLGSFSQMFIDESSMSCLSKIEGRWRYLDSSGVMRQAKIKFRVVLDALGNVVERFVDFNRLTLSFSGKRFEIDKDITSIERIIDSRNLITACYGRGKGEEVETENMVDTTDNNQEGTKSEPIRVNFSEVIWNDNFDTFSNGDFEDGLDSWIVINGDVTLNQERTYRGSNAIRFNDTVDIGEIQWEFPFTVVPNERIDISLWANTSTIVSDGVLKGICIKAIWQNGGVPTGTFAISCLRPETSNAWELLEYTVNVPTSPTIDGFKLSITTMSPLETGSLWVDFVTISNPTNKPLNQTWVEDSEAKARWGRGNGTLNRFGVFYDDDELNPSALLYKTWVYLQNNKEPRITYEADVIDISLVQSGFDFERVDVSDLVLISDNNFKPPLLLEANVIERNTDYLRPQDSKIKLANFYDDVSTVEARTLDLERRMGGFSDIWNRGSNFQDLGYGNRIRMIEREGEFQSQIKYQDDSNPPNLVGYFSPLEFNYRKIVSDEFMGQNIITVMRRPLDFYIDSYAGDDMNDGMSPATAFKSIGRVLRNETLPRFIIFDVNIHILDTTPSGNTPYVEDLVFMGFQGGGILFINFDNNARLSGSMTFTNCTAWIYIQRNNSQTGYGYISSSSGIPLRFNNCVFAFMRNMRINANNMAGFALFSSASNIDIQTSVFENASTSGIGCSNTSVISIENCRGSNGGYAIRLTQGSRVGVIGTMPLGSTGGGNTIPFVFLNSGCIFAPSFQTSEANPTTQASPSNPYSPPMVVTTTCLCTTSTTYQLRTQLYRTDDDSVYQGSWNLNNQVGMMFFNGNPKFQDIRDNATEILSAQLFIKRGNTGGLAGNRDLHLYALNITSPRPADEFRMSSLIRDYGNIASLMWGEEIVINLPSEFFSHVLSGLARGFAIFEEDGEPFIRLDGISDYEIKCVFKYI